ncbi:unnamed protein product [Rhizoctonia solani]|uniref:Uncharacterized protein n=1 Tax=Rhizoctonia solani TaxID=456999 RepID=A0A8H2WEW0_9AGAM|nr:unnamed protein product [Rhizoctonia solani]
MTGLRESVEDLGQIIKAQGHPKPATPNKGKGPDPFKTPWPPRLGAAISFAAGTSGGEAPPKTETEWHPYDGETGDDLGATLDPSNSGPPHALQATYRATSSCGILLGPSSLESKVAKMDVPKPYNGLSQG